MSENNRFFAQHIVCNEIIIEDHSVFSRQWIRITHFDQNLLTPAFLVKKYMAFIRRFTLSIIRPVQSDRKTTFTLFGSSFPLLIFSGPEFSEDDLSQTAALRIEGGFLVQRNECGKGLFSFIIENAKEGIQIAVQVCDYCPLLLGGRKPSYIRKWAYRCTQALIHKIAVSRFLYHMCRELESGKR
jgi:hypothetical protein